MHQPSPSRFLSFVSRATLFAFLVTSVPLQAIAADPPAAAPRAGESAATTQEQTSSTALCDQDLGDGGVAGGYGSVVYKWPEWGPRPEPSKEYQGAAKRYLEDRKKVVLDQNTATHLKYGSWGVAQPLVAADKPNLTRSLQAVKRFYDISFGQNSAVIFLCEYKRRLVKNEQEFNVAKVQASKLTGEAVNACEGANKQMYETYKGAKEAYEKLEREIKKRLEGFTVPEGPTKGTKIPGLHSMFFWARKEHYAVNKFHKPKIEAIAKPDVQKLDDEFQAFWGKGSVTHGDSDKIDSNGYFSDFLLQTRSELKKTEEKKKWFDDNKAEFEKLEQRCDSLENPAISRPERPGSERPTPERPPTERPTPEVPTAERPSPERPTPENPSGPVGPVGPTGEETTSAGPAPKGKGSNTGLWVLGGAAAVGAAVFGWKAYKDNQKSKEFRQDLDAYLASSRGVGEGKKFDPSVLAGITGSPGSGSVPAGTKIIIKSAVGNVSQGATMSPITVVLVDQNGAPVKSDNVAIEAGCLTPQPCSLTGGKSVTTIGGEATFDSLVFNMAHTGVQLQFSAPGVPTAASPSFDVTPTDIRRRETIDQIDFMQTQGSGSATGTSTNTNTNTRE